MEADELKSDLYALRQLYRLLQSIIGCGVPNITPQNVCESLEKRALQMLKNLLDNATQQKLSEMRIQATTRKPKPYFSPQIIDSSSKQLIIHSNIISDQQITNDNNYHNNYKLQEADFDSSSTGFSTPTFNDDDNNIDHVLFSNQVSKAIEEIGSNISALQMEENGGTKFLSDQNSAPRIPSSTLRATSTDCNNNNNNRRIIIGPSLLGHENWLRNQQVISEPESSYDEDDNEDGDDDENEGFYESSSEESSANIPSESSDLDDDDDDVGSSSGINSGSYSSSYGTAKSETNPNYYALRRKVQDYSEKAARVSTLRRIKDKLGLIFHHHHHHHHHHHNYRDERRDRWKPPERTFDDHDNKDKTKSNYEKRFDYPNRNNENYSATRRRSMAKRSGTSTNYPARRSGGGGGGAEDLGHFRALVKALTRHVRGGGDRKKLAAVKMSGGGGGVWRDRLGRGRGVRINYNGNYRKRQARAGFNNRASIQLAKLKL